MTPPVVLPGGVAYFYDYILLPIIFQLFRFLYLYLRILSENRRRGVCGG